jgi:hypothetical protein
MRRSYDATIAAEPLPELALDEKLDLRPES